MEVSTMEQRTEVPDLDRCLEVLENNYKLVAKQISELKTVLQVRHNGGPHSDPSGFPPSSPQAHATLAMKLHSLEAGMMQNSLSLTRGVGGGMSGPHNPFASMSGGGGGLGVTGGGSGIRRTNSNCHRTRNRSRRFSLPDASRITSSWSSSTAAGNNSWPGSSGGQRVSRTGSFCKFITVFLLPLVLFGALETVFHFSRHGIYHFFGNLGQISQLH